jgi:predicted HTH transcriptional regulator
MEPLELLDIISLGETSTVQFKRSIENNDKLAAEICAFANSTGGMILFGVEDDGTVCGLDAAEVRSLNSRIANVSSNNVREPVFPTSEVVKIDDHTVLVASISESQSKPHFDQSGAIWVKSMGDKRRVTSREELRRIFQDTHVFYADEQPISRASSADIDHDTFLEFYRKEYDENAEIDLAIDSQTLENLNLGVDGRLTLAGLLFFGKDPSRFRPEFEIKAVSYVGDDPTGMDYRDSEDIGGTLPEQLTKALAFLRRNLHHAQGNQSFNTEGELEIPSAALEELLVNMLVHRNYFIAAPNKLFIFDNRIEIVSPGCLPNSLTIEQVKSGSSIPRNPILHGLASRIMPYRGIGTGIRRALRLYPRIEIENSSERNELRVVLARPPENR